MTYHVYENWQAHGHSARIHVSACAYCQHGQGFHPGASDAHGKWHGPFDTLRHAQQAADRMNARVNCCKHCLSAQ